MSLLPHRTTCLNLYEPMTGEFVSSEENKRILQRRHGGHAISLTAEMLGLLRLAYIKYGDKFFTASEMLYLGDMDSKISKGKHASRTLNALSKRGYLLCLKGQPAHYRFEKKGLRELLGVRQ